MVTALYVVSILTSVNTAPLSKIEGAGSVIVILPLDASHIISLPASAKVNVVFDDFVVVSFSCFHEQAPEDTARRWAGRPMASFSAVPPALPCTKSPLAVITDTTAPVATATSSNPEPSLFQRGTVPALLADAGNSIFVRPDDNGSFKTLSDWSRCNSCWVIVILSKLFSSMSDDNISFVT